MNKLLLPSLFLLASQMFAQNDTIAVEQTINGHTVNAFGGQNANVLIGDEPVAKWK